MRRIYNSPITEILTDARLHWIWYVPRGTSRASKPPFLKGKDAVQHHDIRFSPDSSDSNGADAKTASPGTVKPSKPTPVSRLGRGLGSLIPASPSTRAAPPLATPTVAAAVPAPASPSSATTSLAAAPAPPTATGAQASAVAGSVRSTSASPSPAATTTGSAIASSTWNSPTAGQAIVELPIARIQRNPRQPREKFDDGAIRALAESIRQDGLLQPIVVRPSGSAGGSPLFELVAGERRVRAFTSLGRTAIPAIVQQVDDRTSAVLALIENVQREDLNPVERAHALQKLMHEFSMSQQDLATRVGLDRSTVANLLRLNDLDPHCTAALREGAITTGHAKALLGLSDVSVRKSLLQRVLQMGMSVRELEAHVREASSAAAASSGSTRLPKSTRVVSAQVAELERRLSRHLGTEVSLRTGRKPGTGAITIKFGSHSQFEGLMDRIEFDLEASDRPGGR